MHHRPIPASLPSRDASLDSRITVEIRERHGIRDKYFKSDAYVISDVQDQTETKIGKMLVLSRDPHTDISVLTAGFSRTEWTAKIMLLTPATVRQLLPDNGISLIPMFQVQQTRNDALQQLKETELESSVLERLGKARMIF